jgi:hypothetical protein
VKATEGKSAKATENAIALVQLGGEARAHPKLGYMARMFVHCTLPHRDPLPSEKIQRTNGRYTLQVQPGADGKVPFGIYPRLIMAYFTQEVQSTKSRTISLGSDFTTFMRRIGIEPSYGPRGTATQVREQMRRLLGSRIWIELDNSNPGWHVRTLQVAEDWDIWFDPKNPAQGVLLDSKITLGERLYQDMIDNPVPFDWRVIEKIKDSPLGVDLYLWLGLRMSYLRKETPISWAQLAAQLGADYSNVQNFTYKAKQQLKRILLVWDDLNIQYVRGRLVLKPSPTHVAQLEA